MGNVVKLAVVILASCMVAGATGCATARRRSQAAPAIASPATTRPDAGTARSPAVPVAAVRPAHSVGLPADVLPAPPLVHQVSSEEPLPPPRVAGAAEPAEAASPPPSDPEQVPAQAVGADSALPVREVTMVNILASVAGRNPEVGFANQRYAEAYARLIAAHSLWLPSINAGLGWNNHAGPLQASNGSVAEVSRSSLTTGLGVQTIGAGSPVVPGLFANFHAAEAIFQPRIAQRAAAARDAAVRTTINDLLLETALAYLELLRAHQSRAIAVDIREHAERLATATADFARSGAGNEADADRAATELAIRQNEVVQADEEIQVASARVVELLNDDPRLLLAPLEPAIAPVELVPLDTPIQALLPTGLQRRPELAEARHLVGEAVQRMKMEKLSPWLPNVLMGTSYAAFGGGQGSQIDNTAGRFDLDAITYWQVRGLGVGEYAARREAQSHYHQNRMQQIQVMNRVSREIVESHAQMLARHRQIGIAERAVQRATRSFERNWLRIRDLEGLPIETLQSIQALDQSRREYLRALVDFNDAQFRLQRALGWPIDLATVPPADTAEGS